MNTPRSHDRPGLNTAGSLESSLVNTPRGLDSPVVSTSWSIWSHHQTWLTNKKYWSIAQQGFTAPLCIHYGRILIPWSIWYYLPPAGVLLINLVDFPMYSSPELMGSHDSTVVNTMGSVLPGGEYTEESRTNTINYMSIWQNSKSFHGLSNRTWRSCLMEKKRQKSRDTVHLNSFPRTWGCSNCTVARVLVIWSGLCENLGRSHTTAI
jgi:hypothetical protein